MRTIKFRAWDKREKRTIGRTEDDGEYTVCFNGEIRCINHGNAPFNVTLPQGLELMQFTGLKDLNGKEIYEGDIVKGVVKRPQLLTSDSDENCNTKMGGYVQYNYSGFLIKTIQNLCEAEREGMCNYFYFQDTYDGDFEDIEVIGNIYENPELLTALS